MADTWQNMHDELVRWRDTGLTPRLWLRDDDAIAPSPALQRLLALSDDVQAPVLMAVIPGRATAELATNLLQKPLIEVAVHGWRHKNHAPLDEKKQELGPHRPLADMEAELTTGLTRLRELFGGQNINVLVPPWNRINPQLIAQLPQLGFTALSTYGWQDAPQNIPQLTQFNCHIDLMNWRQRCGKSAPEIAHDLTAALREARHRGGLAVGVLGHHLVHDETAWAVLEKLLTLKVEWLRFSALR